MLFDIELRRDTALFSFEAEHRYARYDKQTADDSGSRGNFAKHSKTHGGRQKGRQELKIGNVTGFVCYGESLAPQKICCCTGHGSQEQDRYKCCSACVTNLGNRLSCKDCQQHCTAHHAPGYCLNRCVAHGEKLSVKEIVAAEDYGCSNHKKEAAAPGQTSLGTVRQQQNGNSGKGRSNGGPSDDADFFLIKKRGTYGGKHRSSGYNKA